MASLDPIRPLPWSASYRVHGLSFSKQGEHLLCAGSGKHVKGAQSTGEANKEHSAIKCAR